MKTQPGTMQHPPGTIKKQLRTMKNHENRPGTIKSQPGTIKKQTNKPPETMKNH